MVTDTTRIWTISFLTTFPIQDFPDSEWHDCLLFPIAFVPLYVNMVKKKGKRNDPEKKAVLQAKKEAKAEKAARKRLTKEARALGQDVDDGLVLATTSVADDSQQQLEALLEQYRRQDEATTTAHTESLGSSFPPARANTTLTLTDDTKKKQAYLFGGEYYDGVENIVVNQLFRYDLFDQSWKHLHTPPPHPPPRCAHTTIYYRDCLYVFGGELATAHDYHHYRDLWKYDIRQQTWTEIVANSKKHGTSPSARSGHAAVRWKHFLIIFGGFYEAVRDTPRWYNDVTVLDLQKEEWLPMSSSSSHLSKFSARPEPRSAANVAVLGDDMLVHGGFSKLSGSSKSATTTTTKPATETVVHTDAWLLHLKPLLSGQPPVWERWTGSVMVPSSISSSSSSSSSIPRHPAGRSGTASVAYQNRLLVFGGVVDTERHHHKVESVFYNDLFAFDVERRKWFPVHVKKRTTSSSSSSRRRRKDAGEEIKSSDEIEEESSDLEEEDDEDEKEHVKEHEPWNLEKLRSNMFAFVDGSGNLVYEKIDEEDTPTMAGTDGGETEEEKEEEKESIEEEKEEEKADEEEKEEEEPKERTPSKKDHPAPSKVITSSSVMALNPETKVPEAVVRSQPLPRIKANMVLDGHTLYVYGGLLEVGDREVTLDDLWSFDLRKRNQWSCLWPGTMHQQVWRGAIHDDDDSYISTPDDELDDSESDEGGMHGKKEPTKRSNRAGLRQEIAEMNETYDLSDKNRTPEPDEVLADFYSRTSSYWNEQAASTIATKDIGDVLTAKEMKREGFTLAQERYKELEPIMERLRELDLQRQEARRDRKDEKKKESSKKKSRQDR